MLAKIGRNERGEEGRSGEEQGEGERGRNGERKRSFDLLILHDGEMDWGWKKESMEGSLEPEVSGTGVMLSCKPWSG